MHVDSIFAYEINIQLAWLDLGQMTNWSRLKEYRESNLLTVVKHLKNKQIK